MIHKTDHAHDQNPLPTGRASLSSAHWFTTMNAVEQETPSPPLTHPPPPRLGIYLHTQNALVCQQQTASVLRSGHNTNGVEIGGSHPPPSPPARGSIRKFPSRCASLQPCRGSVFSRCEKRWKGARLRASGVIQNPCGQVSDIALPHQKESCDHFYPIRSPYITTRFDSSVIVFVVSTFIAATSSDFRSAMCLHPREPQTAVSVISKVCVSQHLNDISGRTTAKQTKE